jgi:hypothetical protein
MYTNCFLVVELIDSAVRLMIEQRASIPNNSDQLSDDTQHQSITRPVTPESASRHC